MQVLVAIGLILQRYLPTDNALLSARLNCFPASWCRCWLRSSSYRFSTGLLSTLWVMLSPTSLPFVPLARCLCGMVCFYCEHDCLSCGIDHFENGLARAVKDCDQSALDLSIRKNFKVVKFSDGLQYSTQSTRKIEFEMQNFGPRAWQFPSQVFR